MPISSGAAAIEQKKFLKNQRKTKSFDVDHAENTQSFLTIESALPSNECRKLYKRSHSTLNLTEVKKSHEAQCLIDSVFLQTKSDGTIFVARTEEQKKINLDRISLDRRGLTGIPIIENESRLRLLSLQHNLINNLDGFQAQYFHCLVFLDLYDNQLDKLYDLKCLENLRVLLIGKNRLKKIDGLQGVQNLEVLDLHGNKISHLKGLSDLDKLKVLNLAGNQIRMVGLMDLNGLVSLEELNLRRNRLKKLLGFAQTPKLEKLFLTNNELQSVEDISSLAKSTNMKEICIENNPMLLGGDCVTFLVSYLPHLTKLNSMQITDQVKKAAMAWRRNKETTNEIFMDIASDVSSNIKRDEVISNARTNWEFIRSQTKFSTTSKSGSVTKTLKNLQADPDFILTPLNSFHKPEIKSNFRVRSKSSISKVPVLPDKKISFMRTSSQDTESSQKSSSSNNSTNEYIRLPPILVPIINKMEAENGQETYEGVGGVLESEGEDSSSSSSEECSADDKHFFPPETLKIDRTEEENKSGTDTSSNISTVSNITFPSTADSDHIQTQTKANSKQKRNIKSAFNQRSNQVSKVNSRASTAKPKKTASPPVINKDREQGGDYLIEICGRFLNIYGLGALRFVDKNWNVSKAHDVHTVKFTYVNFNGIAGVLNKLKHRFPNANNFIFNETNICTLGQLNALAEIQGFTSLTIDEDGNPITKKHWRSYAVFRLAHWGLKVINDIEVTEEDIKSANEEYCSLSDLVLMTLPEILLEPLLNRLRIDINNKTSGEQNAKQWLMSADPALRSVVIKEALQWKKGGSTQEDSTVKQKANQHLAQIIENLNGTVLKLRILDEQWPSILHEFVKYTLLDYSQLDLYMKRKLQELSTENISKI